MKRKEIIFGLLIIMAIVLFMNNADAQCAMCKNNIESNLKATGQGIGRNINKGILYLMAVPYLAIGFIFRKQLISFFTRSKH